jgi:hypothetical protein
MGAQNQRKTPKKSQNQALHWLKVTLKYAVLFEDRTIIWKQL